MERAAAALGTAITALGRAAAALRLSVIAIWRAAAALRTFVTAVGRAVAAPRPCAASLRRSLAALPAARQRVGRTISSARSWIESGAEPSALLLTVTIAGRPLATASRTSSAMARRVAGSSFWMRSKGA
jgi:hypothetical protein